MSSMRVPAAAASALLVAASVSAQTSSGGIASAHVSAVKIGQDTGVSIAAAVGYRFTPIVAVSAELMFVPSVKIENRDIVTPLEGIAFENVLFPSPVVTVENDSGHATIFITNVRLTIPTRLRRLSPYLIAGAGVGTVTDKFQYTISYPPPIFLAGTGAPAGLVTLIPTHREAISRTTTDFATTLGGGVSFATGRRNWSLDVEARYLGIFGPRDIRTGRYGGGITYRF
jgi:opacity protein-like surface antigen